MFDEVRRGIDDAGDEDAVVGAITEVLVAAENAAAPWGFIRIDTLAARIAAVVRDHQPVKPGRDALAAAIRLRHREMGSGVETVTVDDYESADAVLDLLPGRSEVDDAL